MKLFKILSGWSSVPYIANIFDTKGVLSLSHNDAKWIFPHFDTESRTTHTQHVFLCFSPTCAYAQHKYQWVTIGLSFWYQQDLCHIRVSFVLKSATICLINIYVHIYLYLFVSIRLYTSISIFICMHIFAIQMIQYIKILHSADSGPL